MSKLAAACITLAFLAGLAWLTLTAPVIPDADDCAARGQPADCWRSYDAEGRPIK